MPSFSHLHDLRAIYGTYCFALFQCPWSFNRMLMRILLHSNLSESLSYSYVQLQGVETLDWTLCPLPV